ncbi:anti-sigma-D factor RsdA [Actinosynnema sp. NPDC059335]|uniref:anti-sigma-D factor RsdA n=1 Tax=Actinosynnema sp. NPDC059335 TaxID=3346804 RepID=UPI00367149BC
MMPKPENLAAIRADDALLDAVGGRDRDRDQAREAGRSSGQLGAMLADWADEIDRGTSPR